MKLQFFSLHLDHCPCIMLPNRNKGNKRWYILNSETGNKHPDIHTIQQTVCILNQEFRVGAITSAIENAPPILLTCPSAPQEQSRKYRLRNRMTRVRHSSLVERRCGA